MSDPDALPKPKQVVLVYKFPIPKTKKIVFQDLFRTEDAPSKEHLSKTTYLRGELEKALETGRADVIQTACEAYLPQLMGFIVAVEANTTLRLNKPLNFEWTSAIEAVGKYPKFYQNYTYKFEAVMVPLVYAWTHVARAFDTLASTPDDQFDEGGKKAALMLRTAAGIFEYVETRELPRWTDLPKERPAELSIKVIQLLAQFCLICAQCVTVKKGLLGGTNKSVLAKLQVDNWRKLEDFQKRFELLAEWKEIDLVFRNFVGLAVALNKATAYKYMSEAVHEEKKYGAAVAYMDIAGRSLKTVWLPSPNTPLAKYGNEITGAKEDIEHVKRSFELENNHVYYEKVPTEVELTVLDPKCITQAEGWVPPHPTFTTLK